MSEPIFTDLATTKQKQRVTNLDAGHAVLDQLDFAIETARVEFYTRLGLAKLNALSSIIPVEPPQTEDEYRYLIASTCEQNMLRLTLLRWLTVLSKEGNASRIYQEWNDVSAFREMSSREKEIELSRLQSDIDRALGILDETIEIGTPRAGRALVINASTDGVGENSLECWQVLGNSLSYCSWDNWIQK